MNWSVLAAGGLGGSDCEAIGDGWLAQPVNAISSLAYVLAGLVSFRCRRRREWVGPFAVALFAVGVGSFLFHGPQPAGTRWLHDVSVVLLLTLVGSASLIESRRWSTRRAGGFMAVAGSTVAIAAAIVPAAGLVAIVASVGFVIVAEGLAGRPASVWAPVALIGCVALAVNVLGRTDGPWCDPDAVLQFHAVWHVLTASAFVVWAGRVTNDAVEVTSVA